MSAQPKPSNHSPGEIGIFGEQRAREYLAHCGFHIIANNLIIHPGELDIIAWNPKRTEVVFVEVKTSIGTGSDHPSAMLTGKKLSVLIRTAQRFLANQGLAVDYRFDMITVTSQKLEHFENITW